MSLLNLKSVWKNIFHRIMPIPNRRMRRKTFTKYPNLPMPYAPKRIAKSANYLSLPMHRKNCHIYYLSESTYAPKKLPHVLPIQITLCVTKTPNLQKLRPNLHLGPKLVTRKYFAHGN